MDGTFVLHVDPCYVFTRYFISRNQWIQRSFTFNSPSTAVCARLRQDNWPRETSSSGLTVSIFSTQGLKWGTPLAGGHFRNFRVGGWDPGLPSLFQTYFRWILLPFTRLNRLNVSGKLPTYPSPKLTLTLTNRSLFIATFQKLMRSMLSLLLAEMGGKYRHVKFIIFFLDSSTNWSVPGK